MSNRNAVGHVRMGGTIHLSQRWASHTGPAQLRSCHMPRQSRSKGSAGDTPVTCGGPSPDTPPKQRTCTHVDCTVPPECWQCGSHAINAPGPRPHLLATHYDTPTAEATPEQHPGSSHVSTRPRNMGYVERHSTSSISGHLPAFHHTFLRSLRMSGLCGASKRMIMGDTSSLKISNSCWWLSPTPSFSVPAPTVMCYW